jgi:serine/threonine protein kinase
MEYVGHSSLNDISFPLANQRQVVSLIIQLAMGIKHLKNNKIIHRDIKPSNILISDKGILKIADFGISKQLNETTMAKTCLGTPFYAAP